MNEQIFNSTFFLSLSTIIVGSFAVLLKYCLRSRCEDVNICFGLIQVHRNVQVEEDIELSQSPSTPTNSDNNI